MRRPDRLKRVVDVAGSSVALLVSLPVMAGVAAVVAVRLGRPVLFVQTRAGLDGRPFPLLKFRTMSDERNGDGDMLPDSDRIAHVGAFLRRWSLDELPSLWNVLRGDMSLTGPRPLLMEYLPLYNAEQARRHEVLPGLSGLAQVSGRNSIDWGERLAIDTWYVDNHTLRMDAWIMMRTVGVVLSRNGVSADGEATMPRFTGTGND